MYGTRAMLLMAGTLVLAGVLVYLAFGEVGAVQNRRQLRRRWQAGELRQLADALEAGEL